METKNSCCCCLLRPPDKDLKIPYNRVGKTEIYVDMLKECFEIHLTTLSSAGECGICDVCVGRLRDATEFKQQVLRSQMELKVRLRGELFFKDEEPLVKSEIVECELEDEALIYQEVKPELSEDEHDDPLPNDGSEVFTEFVRNVENQLASECNQEPSFGAPVTGSSCTVYTCDACGKQYSQKKKLASHKRIHLAQRYSCELCNKKFKFKCHLDRHSRRFHAGAKTFPCDKCNKKFGTNCTLNKHKLSHNGKQYRCSNCDKVYTGRLSFNAHKRTHIEKKPYNCDICGAKVKAKLTLIAHMGRHMGQKNFRCQYCSTMFWNYHSLVVHKRSHVEQVQNYACDVCNKVFKLKHVLTAHLKTHLNLKYPCDICAAKLATPGYLKLHKLRHKGHKPYSCEHCNKQFSYKHHLRAHLFIHTGEKPYCCEICGKRFGRRDNLRTHLLIHQEGKRFQCEVCNKSYPTKEGLRQHRRTHKKVKSTKSTSKSNKTKTIYHSLG